MRYSLVNLKLQTRRRESSCETFRYLVGVSRDFSLRYEACCVSRKRIFSRPIALRSASREMDAKCRDIPGGGMAIFKSHGIMHTVLHHASFLPISLSPLRIKIANLRDAWNRSADDNGRSARAGHDRAAASRRKAADKQARYQFLTATANIFARRSNVVDCIIIPGTVALLFGYMHHAFTSLTLNCVTLSR